MNRYNFSKVDIDERDFSIKASNKIATFFGLTIDQLLIMDNHVPQEITSEDKTLMEKVKLNSQLEPYEKSLVLKMIDTFLTKKKFKGFFQKNIIAL